MTSLPVLNCDDCGACCTQIGAPPGYSVYFPPPNRLIHEWAKDGEDYERFKAMPVTIRKRLEVYYRRVYRGLIPDRYTSDMPCLWYDADTRKCKHYEWRPNACRNFEVGGSACINHRERAGVG